MKLVNSGETIFIQDSTNPETYHAVEYERLASLFGNGSGSTNPRFPMRLPASSSPSPVHNIGGKMSIRIAYFYRALQRGYYPHGGTCNKFEVLQKLRQLKEECRGLEISANARNILSQIA